MRFRALIFTVGGLAAAAIVAAIAYWFLVLQPHGAPPASVVTATFAPTPAPSSPAAAPAVQASAAKSPAAAPSPASTPAFDIVRVEPSGEAVIAGRAAPSARVELSDDGKSIGDAAANDAGQFVILPAPLSPGRHPLRLSAKVGDGAPQVSDVVVVEVAAAPAAVAAAPAATPSPAAKPAPTVAAAPTPTPAAIPATSAAVTPIPAATSAAATPTAAASAAASTPTPSAKPAATPTPTVAVAVASVRPVDPAGLEAVGSAPAGAHVRLRLNNSVLAEVIAGADGEWRLTIERGLTAGDYVLEAAAIDAAGAILARAEAPFVYLQREAVAIAAPATPAAAPSPAASSPAAVEPTPAALRPSASTPVASAAPAAAPSPAASSPAAPAAVEPTSAASTPVAAAAPSSPPSPAASSAAAEPTPTATPAAPAPTARVAAEPAPSAASPASTPAAAETPLATAAHAVVAEVSTYTVVKGDNLWDLAIKYYGDGLRYADIFSANSSQIRDPNLIYIGQIFVVPPKPTTNPPPAR